MIKVRDIMQDDLEMIMRWRMSGSVNRYMNTSPELTMEKQLAWFHSLKENRSTRYWVIEIDDVPVGVIDLLDIDYDNRNTSWGYYIGVPEIRSLRLAVSLEMSLYDYCFDKLGFEEVHNEVLKINRGVWKLHEACGCRIVETVLNEIEKDGERYDVVHLSITKEEWYRLRSGKIYERIAF